MNALPLMARAAEGFRARLMAEPGCRPLPLPCDVPAAEGLDWRNTLLRAEKFRRAHVEIFTVAGRLSVLHVCLFPHLDDPAPVFGFDMVAGPARVTGIFLDLSPVIGRVPCPSLRQAVGGGALAGFGCRRPPPDWGAIFSGDFLAIRPLDLEETQAAIALAGTALEALLASAGKRTAEAAAVAAGQARYVAGQRRNEHTFRMLAGFIGPDPAQRFIESVLFPAPETADGNQKFT
jgi:phycocyanobilin:ferredoxin oxidoreductase